MSFRVATPKMVKIGEIRMISYICPGMPQLFNNTVPRWSSGGSESRYSCQEEEEARPNSGGEKRDALIAIDSDQDDLEDRGGCAEKYLTAPQQADHTGVQRRHHRTLTPLFHVAAEHLAAAVGSVRDEARRGNEAATVE